MTVIFSIILLGGSAFAASGSYLDRFNTVPVTYSENDGTQNFSSAWQESGESGGTSPSSGKIQIVNKQLKFEDLDTVQIDRSLDLSGYASVVLTLDHQRTGGDEKIAVELWNKSTQAWDKKESLRWSSQERFTLSLDAEYRTDESMIRFESDSGDWDGSSDTFVIDNVKFRAFADTDGDGVADNTDIDDDNDGIVNAIEFQGKDKHCPRGFYQSAGSPSQLRIIGDTTLDLQMNIGDTKPEYNALAFNEKDGYLYAVTRATGNDDDGHSLAEGDIIRVDRYTGKVKYIASGGLKSYGGDIYNGKFYYMDSNDPNDPDVEKTFLVFNLETQAFENNISLSERFVPGDFVIVNGIAYGDRGTANEPADNRTMYKADLATGNVDSTVTFTLPGATSPTDGSYFLANTTEMYAANNGKWGGIYRIDGYDTASPTAVRISDTLNGARNDGASCRTAPLPVPVDSDGDGVADYHDLDSDNDGIPDNVEANTTAGYNVPSGTVTSDGIWDNYGEGVVPADSDGDGTPDYLDTDSDNDGYTDCEEGINPSQGTTCPLTGAVGSNGLLDSLESADDYNSTNNGITDPDPDSGTDMLDEYAGNHEAAYREFLCGKALITLTDHKWRLISLPCHTGSLTVDALFGPSIGTYGDDEDYVMYRQDGNDGFEVNATHKNTDKIQLSANDELSQGASYWIIADGNHTITIDKTLSGLTPTTTAASSTVNIDDPDFTEVHTHPLPDNEMTHGGDAKKYMAGNPFPYGFLLRDLYFSHDQNGNANYKPMGDSANNTYINATFYKHDSADTSDKDTGNGGGYEAVNAQTPGFDFGGIKAMEGFFIKIENTGDTDDNWFAYPLIMKNGSGN